MPSSEGTTSGELSLPQERIIYGFDEAATGLAGGTISRRKALKLTGSALLGGGLLAIFAGEAEARDRRDRQCTNKPSINNSRCPKSRCGLNRNCRCATTVRDVRTCVTFKNRSCPRRNECNRTRDCRREEVCVVVGGCCGHKGRHLCAPKC
jgi:hypothetical protein